MKLAASTRESRNLQEELSEAFRIKAQLAELHQAEVAKNIEADKQVKFFQGSVAAAFAERDQSLLEAEKAKEKEELMSQKFIPMQTRLEELSSDLLQQKRRNDELLLDLAKQEQQNENLKKVVNKFFEIRQQSSEGSLKTTSDEKCECLLHDPVEVWNYNDPSTSDYISALEEELETVRKSVDDLRNKMRMGLDIEKHLRKKVCDVEKNLIRFNKVVMSGMLELHKFYSQHRLGILNLLAEEKSQLKSTVDMIEEHIKGFNLTQQNIVVSEVVASSDETECRDVHVSTVTDMPSASTRNDTASKIVAASNEDVEASEVLKQALQEKVQTLLLLSQQEERQLLERNVNGALQKKIEELQRNLLQVTHEKVKALMELAQLKQEHQQLQEKLANEAGQGNSLAEKKQTNQERDVGIKNVLKKTYLRRWLGTLDSTGRSEVDVHSSSQGDLSGRKSNSMNVARMKIENATLKESLESMEHLVSSTHRLRLALTRIRESMAEKSTEPGLSGALDGIISEAKLVKTALGSSLPISWSAEVDVAPSSPRFSTEPSSPSADTTDEKMDFVSAAGFEMVELLILAAQVLKETISKAPENGKDCCPSSS
ncbi:unnamed protein product [Linum tenue]|uniref:Uncharacterized protein n=1 Tax=Linum tenue TaxID=586396 RepID=A0AAV0LZN1_9ROSI|nr:unnamed protein product [Linum tenue]